MKKAWMLGDAGRAKVQRLVRQDRRNSIGQKNYSHRNSSAASSDLYAGYFVCQPVVDTSGDEPVYKIKVIDGGNTNNTICGRIVIGNQTFDVDVTEFEIEVPSEGATEHVIVAYVYYDAESEGYSVGLQDLEEIPNPFPDNTVYYELSNYTIDSEAFSVSQVWQNGTIYTNRDYWT